MNDLVITRIKEKILELANKKNLSIYQLANLSDVSDACIRNWYSKRNYVPSLDALEKICQTLGISLVQLFVDKDDYIYPVDKEIKSFLENFLLLNIEDRRYVIQLVDRLKG